MRLYGLIGHPLSHSWSKDFFTRYFRENQLPDCKYENFDLPDAFHFPELIERLPTLMGLNVTHPHKRAMLDFVDDADHASRKIGAINCILFQYRKNDFRVKGFNTDYIGFLESYQSQITKRNIKEALILGTGGSAMAVAYALESLNITSTFVSRQPDGLNMIGYEDLVVADQDLFNCVIQATPLGMFPNESGCPPFPFERLQGSSLVIDLIYNPIKTLFLCEAEKRGAQIENGKAMLESQALASWKIWQSEIK